MQVVIPMAGAGRRFAEAGYTLPKPMIPVLGVPMVVRAVRDLPAADIYVFVCQREHVCNFRIGELLEGHFPGCKIVVAPELTAGQACSVRLAAEHLDPSEPVLVAACDNTHLYDFDKFQRLAASDSDCLIWTYRHDPRVLVNPQAHGWVGANAAGHVSRVSVKMPLTAWPLADHAITGCFWFRTAAAMIDGIDNLVSGDRRINNEFYLDSVPELLLDRGLSVRVFEVDKYIGWGTPEDLDDYLRWQRYCDSVRQAA